MFSSLHVEPGYMFIDVVCYLYFIALWFYDTNHWKLYVLCVYMLKPNQWQELKISNSYKDSARHISYIFFIGTMLTCMVPV